MSREYTLQRAPSAAAINIDYASELNQQQLAAVTVIKACGKPRARTPG